MITRNDIPTDWMRKLLKDKASYQYVSDVWYVETSTMKKEDFPNWFDTFFEITI